jgi:peptidylprolyl isomerase
MIEMKANQIPFMKITSHLFILFIITLTVLTSCKQSKTIKNNAISKTPYEIIDQAPSSDWRKLDLENSLLIELETGTVIVELAVDYAPNHVANTKALVREGLFNGTSFYRVIDGFVAQGGPAEPEKLVAPKKGNITVSAEFSLRTDIPLDITPLGEIDNYAQEVGFYKGFAVGRSADQKDNWLLHCYGSFAMGRANEVNSGGTELYVVIGNAQRYLDKNTTVFGRVVAGMEHIQYLKRSTNINGTIDLTDKNKIISIKVASDITNDELVPIEIMKTSSQSFIDLIQSRKNRTGEWFIDAKNYIDVCSVPVPSRLQKK